jgi:hypothetical protein
MAVEAVIRRFHFMACPSYRAVAGIDVTFHPSAVPGAPNTSTRSGYRVLRRAGRSAVFPGAESSASSISTGC